MTEKDAAAWLDVTRLECLDQAGSFFRWTVLGANESQCELSG
jgi:hypothetical protein